MLDGPRLPPRRGKATSLVVLLHGYGANGDDLISLGQVWQPALPETAFVAPHAPEPVPGAPGGRQWFPLTLRDPTEFWRGATAAAPRLDAFLGAELKRHAIPASRLVLVGFSQGTMMALHAGPRRATPPAGIVGFSGLLAGPEHLASTTVRAPVLLIHGSEDELIPLDALHISREALGAAGFPIEWHVREGLGHGIDQDGLEIAAGFIVRSLRRAG